MGLLFCCGEYCKGVTVYAEMTSTFLGQNWADIKTKGTFQKSELIPRLVILKIKYSLFLKFIDKIEGFYYQCTSSLIYSMFWQVYGSLPYFANVRQLAEISTVFVNQRLVLYST